MESVMIFGRLPALSLAELESLYGADAIRPIGDKAAIVKVDPCLLAFDRLGGSPKFCKHLTTLDTTDWKQIEKFLISVAPGHSQKMPEGKMRLGLSVIGLDVTLGKLESTGLTMKKAIKKTGRNVRLVPNSELELNTAKIQHNQLTGPTGWELVFIRDGQQTIVAQTVKVQDIDAYTRRDRERPKRDAKVGMLPPKLAQTLINLAVGRLPEQTLSSICDIPADQPVPRANFEQTILDPFCGTGVVLQEAVLMGYDAYGTDLEPRMVEYSEGNLDWLHRDHGFDATIKLAVGDATTHQWTDNPVDFVASETYLGRPFTAKPNDEMLQQTASECNLIIKKFLKNLHGQLKPGTRLCLAVPAWQIRRGQFKHLSLLDSLEELGYNHIRFEHVRDDQLLYYREDQVVARELLVLTTK
jgi:tRNA G10  N-methylase Trm11